MPALRVEPQDDGVRVDRFLRQRLPHVPLSQVYRLIRTGAVRRNGTRVRNSDRLAGGDELQVRIAAAEVVERGTRAERAIGRLSATGFFRRNFRVVFEDEVVLVCDKPSGLVVHPGSGHSIDDTLVGLAVAHLLRGGERSGQPYLVHRIDRDTSGLILLAKDRASLRTLHESLRAGQFEKNYLAVCHGGPPRDSGQVATTLERTYERNDGTSVRVGSNGQQARSRYRVLRRTDGLSLLAVGLETGRTHQIRVQMAHLGCPVVGDVRYGDRVRDSEVLRGDAERRLYLHAARLGFPHPATSERIALEAPVPECFAALMQTPLQTGSG